MCGEVDGVVCFGVVVDSDFDVAVGVCFGVEVWAFVDPVGDPGDDAVFVTGGGGDCGEFFEPLDVGLSAVIGNGVLCWLLWGFGGFGHVGG